MIITEATGYDEQVAEVEKLMEKEDFSKAIAESSKVVDEIEPNVPALARASLLQGVAMMSNAMNDMAEQGIKPPDEVFEKVWHLLSMAHKLDPEDHDAEHEKIKVAQLLREMTVLSPPPPPEAVAHADYDVLIVGAGAAGIGTSLMLTETFNIPKSRVTMIERGAEVGESFRQWPKEMRFISPSFNQQGWTDSFDLNAIARGTSPAYSLHAEHPSGDEYASYLAAIARTNDLNIKKLTEVVSVTPVGKEELPLFNVVIKSLEKASNGDVKMEETLSARYIVWAAGEFQYPQSTSGKKNKTNSRTVDDYSDYTDETQEVKRVKTGGKEVAGSKEDGGENKLPGWELCRHNSTVRSWAEVPGDEFIVIGGYESGTDACVNLARAGKKVTMMASTPCWSTTTTDPSAELAPYTAARLRDCLAPTFSPQPKLHAPLRVTRVEKAPGGGFNVIAEWKEQEDMPHAPLREMVQTTPAEPIGAAGTTITVHTPNPPILSTGFVGSVAAKAGHLFDFADGSSKDHKGCLDGAPLLSAEDESTKVPGVFLVGPTVSQGSYSFCFVYKFRQRFAVVANAICGGLGIDTKAAVAQCRKDNMYLDDLSCCGDSCGDVC